MAKKRERIGIFGDRAWMWRGAVVKMKLDGEGETFARLRTVHNGTAHVEMLDPSDCKTVVAQRTLPWPPNGEVRVLRTPL